MMLGPPRGVAAAAGLPTTGSDTAGGRKGGKGETWLVKGKYSCVFAHDLPLTVGPAPLTLQF